MDEISAHDLRVMITFVVASAVKATRRTNQDEPWQRM